MDPDRAGPHLASDPQRVGQALTHLLTLNRSGSVNVNLGEDAGFVNQPTT